MQIIHRTIQKQIQDMLFKGKAIVLYGSRRVGKTTLVQEILNDYKGKSLYLNCDLSSIREVFLTEDLVKIKQYLGDAKLVVLDEAQTIENIGKIMKILVDSYPEIQIIATGSSSFDLANKTGEPLVGRAYHYLLYPFSISEIVEASSVFQVSAKIENILRFGLYPEVFFSKSEEDSRKILEELVSGYLYKDILSFEGVRKPGVISDLLKLLSLQLGSPVSYDELSRNLKINPLTVRKYMDLLEQSFVIFRIGSLSRNPRKEVSKPFKVYFYDLGIRNALIQNHNQISFRNDIGALWENFCIIERIKKNKNSEIGANYYIWRSYAGKEIDFIEERGGKLHAFEFKWKGDKAKYPSQFMADYPNSELNLINRDNFQSFIL